MKVLRWFIRALAWLAALAVLLVLALLADVELDYRTARRAASQVALPSVAAASDADPAPVVILLHGATLNAHMWDPVIRHLDRRLRAIALDLPGHGTHRDQTYTLEGATVAIAQAAASVAPAPVILVGDSLGGYSAMAAAHALPREQLRGLVVSGASANFSNADWPSYVGQLVLVRALVLFGKDQDLAERAVASVGIGSEDARTMLAAGVELRALAPAVRAMMPADFRAMVAAIEQPVLIVNGGLDTHAVEQEDSFVAAAQDASRYRFEQVQHGVSMRRSAEFAGLVNQFAARVLAPAEAPTGSAR